MPIIHFTEVQKAQLVGWLNREKDYMLSVKSMAEKIILPGVTGTLELIRNDFDFVMRVRAAFHTKNRAEPVEMSVQDGETLVDVARANPYANREHFWRSIIDAVEQGNKPESIPNDQDSSQVL